MTDESETRGSHDVHELERKRHERVPHQRESNPDDILLERNVNDGAPVVAADQEGFIGPFETASRKVAKGLARWESLLTPFEIITDRRGKVELRRRMKFYYEPIEGHVRAEEVRANSQGRILVTLKETGVTYPRRSWEFRTIDLAKAIESGDLKTMREVNERAEEALQSIKTDGGNHA